MSLHRETKISDSYEILGYIGQGTYANVCRVRLVFGIFGRCIKREMLRVGFMR